MYEFADLLGVEVIEIMIGNVELGNTVKAKVLESFAAAIIGISTNVNRAAKGLEPISLLRRYKGAAFNITACGRFIPYGNSGLVLFFKQHYKSHGSERVSYSHFSTPELKSFVERFYMEICFFNEISAL